VAALHVGELLPALPREAHDQPVDAVVLPDRGLVLLPTVPPGTIGA
jgi:5-formyltetrahydrofolate cyclo-ligase